MRERESAERVLREEGVRWFGEEAEFRVSKEKYAGRLARFRARIWRAFEREDGVERGAEGSSEASSSVELADIWPLSGLLPIARVGLDVEEARRCSDGMVDRVLVVDGRRA